VRTSLGESAIQPQSPGRGPDPVELSMRTCLISFI